MTMSDVIRNILASALVENSTDLKCLEPYIHTKQTELGVGSDRSALREKRRGKLEAMRKSFGQFSMEKLHGFNDGDLMCRPAAGALRPKNVPRGSSTVAVEHPKRKETFCECGAHDQRTITKSWKARLKEIEDDILLNLRSPVFFAPQHLLRNDLLCSSNLNTVLLNRTVLVWFPHAITTACTLESMSCWTEGCVGGNISMCRINQRIVEGVRSLEFILYAEYRCSKCHRDKSSLDGLALTTMGVPCSIIKQCPVVEFNDSLWTEELFDDFAGSITTKLGPGEFANVIEEKRKMDTLVVADQVQLSLGKSFRQLSNVRKSLAICSWHR